MADIQHEEGTGGSPPPSTFNLKVELTQASGEVPRLKLPPEQADLIAARVSLNAVDQMETHSTRADHEDPAQFLALAETLDPLVALARELRETRETIQVKRVDEIAKEILDSMQGSVGYECVCLLRAQEGEPEFVEGYEDQAAAVKHYEEAVAADARKALLARRVVETIRDFLRAGETA
jgi:hypothetical protein